LLNLFDTYLLKIMATDFSDFNSVTDALEGLLQIPSPPASPIPPPLILTTVNKGGMSATKSASNVIQAQAKLGLNVGALPSGKPSPAEQMEVIRFEEIIRMLTEDARITVAIPPGVPITATGANAGGPVQVVGSTITIAQGYAVIQ
jgi:hypothetical protein